MSKKIPLLHSHQAGVTSGVEPPSTFPSCRCWNCFQIVAVGGPGQALALLRPDGSQACRVVLQPSSDLLLIPPDPFDVVPDSLQRLLPRHLPGTSKWPLTEEMLHLQEQRGEDCYRRPNTERFAVTRLGS